MDDLDNGCEPQYYDMPIQTLTDSQVSGLPTLPEQASNSLDPAGISRQIERGIARRKHDRDEQADTARLIARHERNKMLAESLAASGCVNYAHSLKTCSVTEGLWYCSNCMTPSYHTNHCKQRLCAHCAPLYSWRRAQLVTLMAGHMHRPSLLTLTQSRRLTLKDGITRIRDAWTKFRHTSIGAKMWGGFYQLECKPKPDGWHVHLHAIVDMPYIPKPSLYKCWAKCLGQDTASIDIQRLKNVKDAAKYATKYATKPNNVDSWTPSQLAEFVVALRRKRLEGTWGTMFNVTADDYLGKIDEPHRICPACGAIASVFPIYTGIANYGADWRDIYDRLFKNLKPDKPLAGLEHLQPSTPEPVTEPDWM